MNKDISPDKKLVQIPVNDVSVEGDLTIPQNAKGIVLFAHGSGSSRLSPRNQFVAQTLNASGIGSLLFDLLTPREDTNYENRFNINLLTQRLIMATRWIQEYPQAQDLPLGYFGASTGAAAALMAAAELGLDIRCVVSRGGRPDLAMEVLDRVEAPTLLIVGGNDEAVIRMNQNALVHLKGRKELFIVPGATHLFEEPGTLEEAARQATQWFSNYLKPPT